MRIRIRIRNPEIFCKKVQETVVNVGMRVPLPPELLVSELGIMNTHFSFESMMSI
jgi:hypothetical protein